MAEKEMRNAIHEVCRQTRLPVACADTENQSTSVSLDLSFLPMYYVFIGVVLVRKFSFFVSVSVDMNSVWFETTSHAVLTALRPIEVLITDTIESLHARSYVCTYER